MIRWMKKHKKQIKSFLFTFVLCASVLFMQKETMFAGEINQSEVDAFMQPFNTLKYMFTTLLSSLGSLYTLWCIGEWGLAWHESQGNVGGQNFKRLYGGIVLIVGPQILSLLT